MKLRLKYIIVLLVILASCKKFLDKKPSLSLAVPTTLKDLQALLDNNDIMNQNSPLLPQVSSDEYYLTKADWSRIDAKSRIAYIWGQEIYQGSDYNDWTYCYRPVYYANEVLDKIETIKRDIQNAEAYDLAKGSALFFRSFNFLTALGIWAKAYNPTTADKEPGIPLRLTADFNVKTFRSSLKESYDQVTKDLRLSAQLLPDKTVHPMRPSRQAAYAVLARAFLYMQEFDSCLAYSQKALTITHQLMDFNTVNASPTFPFAKFNSEVLFHSRSFNTYATTNYTLAKVDSVLYASYSANDLRKTLFYRRNADGSYFFRGSFDKTLYTFNGVLLSELYLMKAECLARLNQPEQALNTLNQLLEKRWVTNTYIKLPVLTILETLTAVLTERKKELAFTNLRWMDIKRLNVLGANITPMRVIEDETYILKPNSENFALPIPPDVIQLTGIEQNKREDELQSF